jgi:pyrroline-5-carboxylate reductase
VYQRPQLKTRGISTFSCAPHTSRVTLTGKRLAFIGGGTMAEAMVRGLLDRHLVPPSHVLVTGPRRERRAELAKTYGVKALASNAEAAAEAHVVVLSVKPQVLATVMRDLRGKLNEDKLVISIVAGATLRSLRDGLDHAAIVRAMPNTPAQVGMGVTAWTPTTAVDAEQRERAKAILGALGDELMVDDENLVDMATALSGTGPTYVFLLMEALVDAGVHLGFSRRVAEELVLRTVEGSAVFARKSGRHLAELRNMVTSPGGTSAAAIYQLEKGALRTVLSKAVYAAYQRTRELGAEAERRSEERP